MLSIHFECGVDYTGSYQRDELNNIAEHYFHLFIRKFREFKWCDVVIYDPSNPRKDIGASRNPPPLPHHKHKCVTCSFADSFEMNGFRKWICCNGESEHAEDYVNMGDSCKEWMFNEELY